jgi:hypothetical protein
LEGRINISLGCKLVRVDGRGEEMRKPILLSVIAVGLVCFVLVLFPTVGAWSNCPGNAFSQLSTDTVTANGQVERKIHEKYPEMRLHYHGMHECRGGAEHARLLAVEGPDGRGSGEAMLDLVGQRIPYGLAGTVVSADRRWD